MPFGLGARLVDCRPARLCRFAGPVGTAEQVCAAAQAALSGRARGTAKPRDGNVEAIRALVVAKRSARSAKIPRRRLAAQAAGLRPDTREGADPVIAVTKTSLRILGRRVLALDEEKARIDALLTELVTGAAPQPLPVHGVGIDNAAAQRSPHEGSHDPPAGRRPLQTRGKIRRATLTDDSGQRGQATCAARGW